MAFGLGGVFEGVQTAANAGVPADSAVAAVAHTICWQPTRVRRKRSCDARRRERPASQGLAETCGLCP